MEIATFNPLINEHFDIAFSSVKKPSKSRCGDHLNIELLENESILIAMVCDGVGSRPADYLASETVCNNWSTHFTKSQGTITERIKKATVAVNDELLWIEDDKKGLMTTQTLVVYDLLNQCLYFQNVGDSRTYIQKKSELFQVTEDDAKSIIVRDKSGKPLKTKDGFVITATGIDNAIGQFGVKLYIKEFTPEETKGTKGIVLVSDGFYTCPDFEKDSLRILSVSNMQEALNIVTKKNLDYQSDDMTAVFIRQKTKNLFNDKDVFTFLKNSSQQDIFTKYSALEISKSILEEIELHLRNTENTETILDLFNLTDKLSIDFGRKIYIQLFDLYKENKVRKDDVIRILLHKMRGSKYP
ncbi:MAG: hypothetical protein M0Q12_08790 [Synergistaceae bacterium]|jgi:serine/threonine protein phosphatase PrpC|nr:hypothetical protein [Synergistaceae bacterium]MDD2262651.1 hypothetical protein [Clostridia bacterium]MDD3094127.1 hypothetical protein [Clostridia bacterium]MDD3971333.1 hypothetical protein [Clostridia bacterium]